MHPPVVGTKLGMIKHTIRLSEGADLAVNSMP